MVLADELQRLLRLGSGGNENALEEVSTGDGRVDHLDDFVPEQDVDTSRLQAGPNGKCCGEGAVENGNLLHCGPSYGDRGAVCALLVNRPGIEPDLSIHLGRE